MTEPADSPTAPAAARSVRVVMPTVRTTEGAGFVVRRPFPTADVDQIDPFLLLDHMGPVDYRPGQAVGAPDHPHRGFETVSYILEGEMEHEDSAGHRGRLGPGDVQWMTAGRGVVHSEMPSTRIQNDGGRVEGFQIWVNLPRADKLTPPRYQERKASAIPLVELDDGRVTARMVAGSAFGATGAVETHLPIEYFHLTIRPGGRVHVPAPAALNAMAYAFRGRGQAGATPDRPGVDVAEGELVVFHRDGDEFELAVPADATTELEVLVLAGEPIGEPIARYGPFVMNTRDEIVQAFDDYQAGRMGEITRIG